MLSKKNIENFRNNKLFEKVNYSNLPFLFEFLKELREKDFSDWSKALDEFTPKNASALIDKYHASSLSLAIIYAQETIGAGSLFYEATPFFSLFKLPIIKAEYKTPLDVKWPKAIKILGKKTGMIWVYNDNSTVYAIFFEPKEGLILKKYSSWLIFEKAYKKFNLGNLEKVVDPWNFIRRLVRFTFNYTVQKRKTEEILRFDLLDEMLSIENLKSEDFPKNPEGNTKFNLGNFINHPDKCFEIHYLGEKKKLSGLDSFNLIVDLTAAYFNLPTDFRISLLFLLQNKERFFKEILASPASTLLSVWGEYKETEQLYKKALKISEITHLSKNKKSLKEQGDSCFNSAVQYLLRDEKSQSLRMFKQASRKYQNLLNSCQESQHIPVEVMLDLPF